MEASGRSGWPLPTVLLLAGIVIVGLAVRLPSLGDSLYADEISTYFVVHGFGVDDPLALVSGDQEVTPPLYFLLAWASKGIGEVEGLRLPALLAGLAIIPAVYMLGLRTVGRRAAIVAAALVALSPLQIFYSTEARAYTLLTLLTLLAVLALLQALETERKRWWAAWAVLAAAALYTHYTPVFVLAGAFAWAFAARPRARRALLISTAGAALLFAPWIPQYIEDSDAPNGQMLTDLLHPFTWAVAKTDLSHWVFGHPVSPVGEVPGDLAWVLFGLGLLAGAVGLLLRLRASGRWWPPSEGVVLVVVLAASAPLIATLYSLFVHSVFGVRYLFVSWPAMALVIGALVCAGRGPIRIAASVLVVAGFAIGAWTMLDEENQRPDYRGAAEFIQETGPGAPVVDAAPLTPGPQTAMELVLAEKGEPLPTDRKVLNLNRASFEDSIAAAAPGEPNVLYPGPVVPDEEVAREAARLAGSGKLFLVTSGDASLEQLRTSPLSPAAGFLAALPPGFEEVESRTFPGVFVFPVTVHVLEHRPPAEAG